MNKHSEKEIPRFMMVGFTKYAEHCGMLSPITGTVKAEVHQFDCAPLLELAVGTVLKYVLDAKPQGHSSIIGKRVKRRGNRVDNKVLVQEELVDADEGHREEEFVDTGWCSVLNVRYMLLISL